MTLDRTQWSDFEPTNERSEPRIAVRAGKVRAVLPLTTVASAILAALGTAWAVAERVINDHAAEAEDARTSLVLKVAELEREQAAMRQSLAVEQAVMAAIHAQLAEIKIQIAAVQATLMQGRR